MYGQLEHGMRGNSDVDMHIPSIWRFGPEGLDGALRRLQIDKHKLYRLQYVEMERVEGGFGLSPSRVTPRQRGLRTGLSIHEPSTDKESSSSPLADLPKIVVGLAAWREDPGQPLFCDRTGEAGLKCQIVEYTVTYRYKNLSYISQGVSCTM